MPDRYYRVTWQLLPYPTIRYKADIGGLGPFEVASGA
jgi:hypothetical protein